MAVTLSEALTLLQSGNYVALRYITANTSKGSGGKVIELAKVKIARQQAQSAVAGNKSAPFSSEGKNPNHGYHFTRNVELQNKMIRTVYPILITHINNETVL